VEDKPTVGVFVLENITSQNKDLTPMLEPLGL